MVLGITPDCRGATLRGVTFLAMQDDSLQIRFDSPEALRAEFEKNISNRGIFVASERTFEARQTLEIEIILSYVDDEEIALSLRGEVVHCIPPEMAANGVAAGVAIQFDDAATELREAFDPLLRIEVAPAGAPDAATASDATADAVDASGIRMDDGKAEAERSPRKGSCEARDRRSSRRGAVRVPVRVMPTMSPPFEATSRDLSASGILLSMKKTVLPVGEVVRICLWHPSGEPGIEIDGRVVRQVANKNGRIAAVAVAFDRNQSADPQIRDVIDALREAGHRNRLGGISGSIVDLGLANMLQMFGSSAPQGTLVLERDGEQGWIAFAEEQFLGAELGGLEGHEAMVAMLDWGEGHFQFEAIADPRLLEEADRRPLQAVVLEAIRTLDERARDGAPGDTSIEIHDSTTFVVDAEREEASRAGLGKTGEAVLDLARAGMSVERLTEIIPEPPEEIRIALEDLVERGVLSPL